MKIHVGFYQSILCGYWNCYPIQGHSTIFFPAIHRWTWFWIKVLWLNSQAKGQDSLRQVIFHLMRSWLIGKDSDAGKDWGQEKKGTTEVEMVGWHHCLNGHGFGWTPGVGDGQRGLACCDSWGPKSWTRLSDLTELKQGIGVVFPKASTHFLCQFGICHTI